jgi:hypothetical protein
VASDFDAHAESEKIVGMFMNECKDLNKNLTIERAECKKRLSDEVSSLTPEQLRSVGLALERRVPTDQTEINIQVDSDARVTGLTFEHPVNWYQALDVRYEQKSNRRP